MQTPTGQSDLNLLTRLSAVQHNRPTRMILAVLLSSTLNAASLCSQEKIESDSLPMLSEMNRPPSFEELMTAEPFDWIVLEPESLVIKCEAVSPRPDTLIQMDQEREALQGLRRPTDEQRNRLKELRTLLIQLPNDLEDYSIRVSQVKEIIGIEDLMLERTALLLKDGDIAKAWDLLRRVDTLAPNWESSKPQFADLLLAEASLRLEQKQPMAALALLDELHARSPEHPDLPDRISGVLRPLIETAFEEEDFGRVHWLAERLSRHFSDHDLVSETNSDLERRANAYRQRAAQSAKVGDFRAAAMAGLKAETIFPSRGKQRNEWKQILARHQIVRVAVASIGNTSGQFPIPSAADRRHQELTQVPLFEASSVDELTHYKSTHIEEWDPNDLGRQVTLILRTTHPHWQSQPVLSASQIADTLSAYLTPHDVLYNPRLASFVAGYSVRSPTRIEIRFSRVPLNMAALFRFPVVGVTDEQAAGNGSAERTVLSTRFTSVDQSDQDLSPNQTACPYRSTTSPRLWNVNSIRGTRNGRRSFATKSTCCRNFIHGKLIRSRDPDTALSRSTQFRRRM